LVTESELLRNPTVKAEHIASKRGSLSGLMLTYPVHQACDILFCDADIVPVGKDQLPHIELTRALASRFNDRYAPIFKLPVGLLSEVPELLGVDGRKMSKSYNNAINLNMTDAETAKMIKKAVTDSDRNITYDPKNRPGVSTLLTLASLTTGKTPENIAGEIGQGGAGALKALVVDAVNSYFAEHRQRRIELIQDKSYLKGVLKDGNERANEIANATLKKLQRAMNMVYY
jgi:tryptophanyl-tRNA synthetase